MVKLKPFLPNEEEIDKNKIKKKNIPPHNIKNTILFYTHFSRLHDMLSNSLLKDLKILLKQSHALLDSLVEISASKLWLIPVIESIQLEQMITQAIWGENSKTGRFHNLNDLIIFFFIF